MAPEPTEKTYSLELRARRVVAARIHSLASIEMAQAYARGLGALAASVATLGPVLCADHRPVVVYGQDVADELVRLFTHMNRVLTRVAIVVAPTNATLTMQLGRIIRESHNPSRQLFSDAGSASRFLTEVLDAGAGDELRQFLAGWP